MHMSYKSTCEVEGFSPLNRLVIFFLPLSLKVDSMNHKAVFLGDLNSFLHPPSFFS
jgi:hypothetical protein